MTDSNGHDKTEPPNLDTIICLLRMTSSNFDGEALTAMRKATQLLTKWGWDWERLLRGKVTIVADPFNNISAPPQRNHRPDDAQPQPPHRPAPTPPPRPQPSAPRPDPWAAPPAMHSTRFNTYTGFCYPCGTSVPAQTGFICQPGGTGTKWHSLCPKCNLTYATTPLPQRAAPRKASSVNLMDGLS